MKTRAPAPARARIYFAGCAALIGFAFGYALPVYAGLPRLFYRPIARAFVVARALGPVPMGYVGQLIWGAAAALLCGGVAATVVGAFREEPSERAYGLWAAWTLTALALVIAYFTWNNWP